TKIDNALRGGIGAPDIFLGEIAYVKDFIDKDYWVDLSSKEFGAEELARNQIQYATDLGRDNKGALRALTFQATPGALFYRRSLAKVYFGTDDPVIIGKSTGNIDSYLNMAQTIYEKSNGEVSLVASYQDIGRPVLNSRKEPWIVNNKIQLEDELVDFIDQAKELVDSAMISTKSQWSENWFTSMGDGSVFSFILPTWGINALLKPNSNGSSGDWAMTTPPFNYFWGGSWFGISKTCENKKLAWDIIKYFASDREQLTSLAKGGEFVNRVDIIEEVLPTISEPFLGGQNHFEYFYEEAKKIDAGNVGRYDEQIAIAYWSSIDLYLNGNISRDEVEEHFKSTVRSLIPGVE
ncbi:MAG: extracellular solute-binding protein, partial [Spirochaetales bacterium]|nr:extracellular solute-binding protein [Spirochaetales bacterium]